MQGELDKLPITDFILNNLGKQALVVAVVITIVLFAKLRGGT